MKTKSYSQSFTWKLAEDGDTVFLQPDGRNTWLHYGRLGELLSDHSRFVDVLPSKNFTLQWAVVKGKKKQVKVYDPPFRRVVSPAQWLWDIRAASGCHGGVVESVRQSALGEIAEHSGLRRLTNSTWTVLAPNAVLHPQFGPGVTMATDGVHTLLWSYPWPGTEHMIVSNSNIIGPITTTPTALWEWCKTGEKASPVKTRETQLSKCLAQMEEALRKHLSV